MSRSCRPSTTRAMTCLAAAWLALPAALGAQERDPVLPDSPEGRLASELFAALNSGSEERQRAFVRARVPRPSNEEELLVEAGRQSGGVRVLRFDAGRRSIRATLRARSSGRLASFHAMVDSTGEHLVGFGMRPMVTPLDSAAVAGLTPLEGARGYVGGLAGRGEFSGTVLVAHGGRVLMREAYGWQDAAGSVAIRPDTRFHIASTGKMFTAIAIAQLAEQGRLRYTDTLGALLPDYPNADARRRVTVHHLLTHTSGLGGLFDRPGFDRGRRIVWQRELFPAFAAEALAFDPGTRDRYSNEGYIVLGAIVERLSGVPFERHVQRSVFRRAGMRTAACEMVGPGGPATPNTATSMATADTDPFAGKPRESSAARLGWECGAAGGEYLSADDLLAFARALHRGSLVSPATFRTMAAEQGLVPRRGYGVENERRRGFVVNGHGGGGGLGISAEMRTVVDGPGGEPLTVVVLSNYDGAARPVAQALLDLFLAPAAR